jgi:hypothetical protein
MSATSKKPELQKYAQKLEVCFAHVLSMLNLHMLEAQADKRATKR